MTNNDDFIVDNLDDNVPKKKRIKCGQKGKRGERELVKTLNTRFAKLLAENPKWGSFSRSVGSGNRWGQKVVLSETASQVYSGDLTCPDNFKFVIESKAGYNDIDLFGIFSNKCQGLDEFLKQASDEGGRTGRKPLLIWKKDRKETVAFIKNIDLPFNVDPFPFLTPAIFYGEWIAVSLSSLLDSTTDEFWFKSDEYSVSSSTIQLEPVAG